MSSGNEPAYPAEVWRHNEYKNGWAVCGFNAGLTKRELIAAMAMKGLLGSDVFMRLSDDVIEANPKVTRSELVASQAIRFADALLAQLSKDPQP